MLYYAQIYSHLSYCIVLWGSMLTTEYKHKLQVLQNKCVKLLDISKATDEIYRKHKILKLEQLVDLEQKKLGYKLNRNLLPPNLAKLMMMNCKGTSPKKDHSYNTRHKKDPNLPAHCSKMYNDSFLVQSLKNYNNIDQLAKGCMTLRKFALLIKEAAIMSYNV